MEAAYARIAVAPVNLQEQDDLVEKINRLISLVSLQLNPFGEIDKNILTILAKMPALAGSPNGQKPKRERRVNLKLRVFSERPKYCSMALNRKRDKRSANV